MPPVEVNSRKREHRQSSRGKAALIAIVALIVMACLVTFSVLRPIVDRNDGPEREAPAVQFPVDR